MKIFRKIQKKSSNPSPRRKLLTKEEKKKRWSKANRKKKMLSQKREKNEQNETIERRKKTKEKKKKRQVTNNVFPKQHFILYCYMAFWLDDLSRLIAVRTFKCKFIVVARANKSPEPESSLAFLLAGPLRMSFSSQQVSFILSFSFSIRPFWSEM